MAINLAEAVKLKSILTKKIHELEGQLRSTMFAIVEKGDEPKQPPKPFTAYEQELVDVRYDARKLDALIYRANIDHTVAFQGESLSIVEAIELATQLRAEAQFAKELASNEKEQFYTSAGETILYRVALFEPTAYESKAIELEKLAHRLSNAINAANYAITLPFDGDKYF